MMDKRRKRVKGPWPIWKLVLVDVLVFAVALNVFALFHHVIPRREEAVGIVSQRVNSVENAEAPADAYVTMETPEPTATVDPALLATPEPTPDPVGYFGTKFADKFTDGEVVRTENSYQSANVNVTLTEVREFGSQVYVADVYVKDISCLRAAFAKDTFGRGFSEWPKHISERKGAIVAINGDYYGGRQNGVVIRNGVLYRKDDNLKWDVGVLYWDGTMKCFSPKEFDAALEMERGAYQAWNFGPMLLDKDGNVMTEFNSKVNPANPRAVIGYYEPGHYCLVVVDGRTNQSSGISLKNLSVMMSNMGCVAAYNLDGGATATMAAGGAVVSKPSDGGRACSDFVMVLDEITEDFGEVKLG